MTRLALLSTVLVGCAMSTELEAEPQIGYAAIATDAPARAEFYTWRATRFEIDTHLPGCSIVIGADDLTDPTECVVLGDAVHESGKLPEAEIWSFGAGYITRTPGAESTSWGWFGASLERTGQPPARAGFLVGRTNP